MEPVLAGLAVLGVLLGSTAVGACMVLFGRERREVTSERARRFVRRGHED